MGEFDGPGYFEVREGGKRLVYLITDDLPPIIFDYSAEQKPEKREPVLRKIGRALKEYLRF